MTARIASRRRRHYRNWSGIGSVIEALKPRTLLSGGPRITAITPTEVINATFDHVDVTWNEAIDPTTFTNGDVTLTGPSGVGTIAVNDVVEQDSTHFEFQFNAQTNRGTYQVAIGPDIADLQGNLMDQNQNGIGGESADQFRANLSNVVASTVFTSPVVISETNTTYDGRDIAIQGTTVTIDGPHSFNSLHLFGGAVLTHSANDSTATHKLDLTVADQVIVDSASRIDVSGKGYLAGRTTGNTHVGAASGDAGGSYGGSGRRRHRRDQCRLWRLCGPGRLGQRQRRWIQLGRGIRGGLVRISATDLELDGQILARGARRVRRQRRRGLCRRHDLDRRRADRCGRGGRRQRCRRRADRSLCPGLQRIRYLPDHRRRDRARWCRHGVPQGYG